MPLASAAPDGRVSRLLVEFDSLEPAGVGQLVGRWRGAGVHSGHPLDGLLETFSWYGKVVVDAETVHPLLFRWGRRRLLRIDAARVPLRLAGHLRFLQGSRLARQLFRLAAPLLCTGRPTARVRSVEFRGRASAALVYDRQPVIDHLRWRSAEVLLGVMDCRWYAAPLFFTLTREARPGL